MGISPYTSETKENLECISILCTYAYSEFGTPITSISLPFMRILHMLL
jgi:hypothetical protein